MKQFAKSFIGKVFVSLLFISTYSLVTHAADIVWDYNTTYTIPDDGNSYYIDFAKTLTADLTVNGTLALWVSGSLSTTTSP